MRWKAIVAAGLIVAVVAAIAALPEAERFLAGRIKTALERTGQITVGSVEVGLPERRVTLRDLHSTYQGDFRARRWQASGLWLPLGKLLRGHLNAFAFRPGDPLHAGRVVLEDARFTDGVTGAGWTVGSMTMEDVDLDRYEAKAVSPLQFVAVAARVGLALSVRHLEESNVVYTLPGGRDTIGADAMMIDGFQHGRIGKLALIGVAAAPRGAKAASIRMSEASAGDVDMRPMLRALSSPAWTPGAPLGRVSVEQASASGFSGETFKRYGLSLGSVTLETSHAGDDASRSRVRVIGLVLAPPAEAAETRRLRTALDSLGLKELRLGLDCTGAADKAAGSVAVESCRLAGAELGTLDFAAKLVGADKGFWQAFERGDFVAVSRSKIALASARLALADNSLLARVLRAAASDSGQPVAVVRANLADQIRHYQPAGVLITEDLTKDLDTVARFVEHGGTLALDAKPDPPFALAKFNTLSPGPDLVQLLGVSATLTK